MSGALLPICSMFFSALLCIIYFSKERVNLLENKMYSTMIIAVFIDSILISILQLFPMNGISDLEIFFIPILNKIDFVFLILYCNCQFLYNLIITIPKIKENFKKVFPIFLIIDLIILVLTFASKVSLITTGEHYSISGMSTYFVYGLCLLYILLTILVVFLNIKKIDKRHTPIFVSIFIIILIFILFQINPYLIIISISLTFINYIMYFTIENPDVKMINELNIAKEQAEKANNAKSDFLSSMSHEIRTPLNAIVGFSQDLSEKITDNEQKEEVKDILMASESLLEIVNGILDISKIEANKLEIVNTEYSFKKIFNELVVLSKARLGEKPLDFRVKYDDSIPPYLYGDYTRLKQIILNLLTNAIKYTKEGYIDFTINSIKKDNICRLIISVEDSGIGIKKENIDKLFTKFERFDKEKNITIEGTGLGLAITKKLVELMNGNIVVQSVYGKGSKFTVAIDQVIVDKKIDEEITNVQNVINDFSKYRVLVVDDNLINLKVASKLLESFKIKIETCDSGYSCLDKIQNFEKFDLILLDDMMPKMSGTETLQKLKEITGFNTPVVALTANAISGMKEKYLGLGFDEYLAKPIDKQELTRVLNKFFLK
ncbi:MAG: ATP-binding protein [Bacilli bacterium]